MTMTEQSSCQYNPAILNTLFLQVKWIHTIQSLIIAIYFLSFQEVNPMQAIAVSEDSMSSY